MVSHPPKLVVSDDQAFEGIQQRADEQNVPADRNANDVWLAGWGQQEKQVTNERSVQIAITSGRTT